MSTLRDDSLKLAIRAALVARGLSLSSWCRSNNLSRSYVEKILTGQRNGPRSLSIKVKIISDCRLSESIAPSAHLDPSGSVDRAPEQ
ncbi:hypothetical protein ACFW16_10075 [Inquilinus sp. NPDC058860]|uniref:hypothetical protein n=1 Tax=Inquilinus sp. NPDC058860 TaxID=3346652 RepID=UPI0036C3697B